MERLRARIEASSIPEPMSGCWLWTGYTGGNNYGQFSMRNRKVYAHRMSWLAYRGLIPDGLMVLHRCDTPPCVNPAHLFLGTQTDNMTDCFGKGRGSPPPYTTGEQHSWTRLTEEAVRDIRRRMGSPRRYGDVRRLAREYGVTVSAVWAIHKRKAWRHLPDEVAV